MNKFCFHTFVDGFGGMGDAVTCVKCGHSKYPEALGLLSLLLCPTIVNDGTYSSREEFPFVVQYPERSDSRRDPDSWTHYFGRDGKLHPRADGGAA